MKVYGCPNLKIVNQVCLYLNDKYQLLLDVQGESVNSIKYKFSKDLAACVKLSDDVREGHRYSRVYADAVRWVYQDTPDGVQ